MPSFIALECSVQKLHEKMSSKLSQGCHGARFIIHFYCLAVEAGFYSDVVECLPVDPDTWVRFPAGAGKIFSLYAVIHLQFWAYESWDSLFPISMSPHCKLMSPKHYF